MAYPVGRDSYIRLALDVIRAEREPMTARQILSRAKERGLMPAHLRGKAQHKTLHARLSEHIRQYRDSALFYRIAPATYFITELVDDPTVDRRYKMKYRGVLRSKQVRQERVLVASVPTLLERGIVGFVPFDDEWFATGLRDNFEFVDRRRAEARFDIKQFVSYTLLVRGTCILSYRRGAFTTVSDQLKGARSIGFGGHINDSDFDLFAPGPLGIYSNATREMYEELDINEPNLGSGATFGRLKIMGLLNVDDTEDARKHVAVVLAYHAPQSFDIRKGELSINQLSWIDASVRLNDLSDFELWSAIILEKIFSREIRARDLFPE